MSVVIVGGNDRMQRMYHETCATVRLQNQDFYGQ